MWLLTRLFVWPVKSLELGYKTGRVVGYRRVFVFGLGVATGLLIAPVTGAELRGRIRRLIDRIWSQAAAPDRVGLVPERGR